MNVRFKELLYETMKTRDDIDPALEQLSEIIEQEGMSAYGKRKFIRIRQSIRDLRRQWILADRRIEAKKNKENKNE